MRALTRAAQVLTNAEAVLAVSALVATFALVVIQVVSRYVFNEPLSWSEELARFALVWLAFVGAGYAMSTRAHIAVDLLAERLGAAGRKAINAFAILVTLVIAGVMTYAGTTLAMKTSALKSTATSLPMPVIYSALAVGFALILTHGILNVVKDVVARDAAPRTQSTVVHPTLDSLDTATHESELRA